MDDKSFNIRVPKRWVRVAMIVGVTALIVAPLTAIASHSFTDVPDSNTFHSDIEWMKASGVTKGCNPSEGNTKYCPDDNVTRGQMAAFMNRFAGYIGAIDGTPAQADHATNADSATSADTLDGSGPNAYRTIIQADACQFATCEDSTGTIIDQLTLQVNAPTAGVLEIASSLHVFGDGAGGDDFVQLWAAVDQTDNSGCGTWLFAPGQAADGSYAAITVPGSEAGALSTTTAVELTAGNHTVKLCSMSLQNTENSSAALTTVWTQGGEGLSPSTAAVSEADLGSLRDQFDGQDLSHIEN